MRTVNTDKMDKVIYRGQEIAFGTCRKNEWGEYVVKVYVDGVYDEDKTIYADSREDAEGTKAQAIKDYTEREDQMKSNKADRNTRVEIKKYIKDLEKKFRKAQSEDCGTEMDMIQGAIIAATAVFHMVYGDEARV